MPQRLVKVDRYGHVALVSLNRPEKMNALDPELLRSFREAIARLREDETVSGIVITGEGKAFCAGADIAVLSGLDSAAALALSGLAHRILFELEDIGKPVIAAVNGAAFGGGLEIALACDFIVASSSSQFSFPEIDLGIIPGFGGTQRLTRLVGKAKAKEMIFTAQRLSADEAHRIGLVNQVFAAESLRDDALALMKKICDRGMLSLRMAKEVIDAGYDMDLRNACLTERDAFALCFTSHDQKEGMSAFIEKRPPRFKGR